MVIPMTAVDEAIVAGNQSGADKTPAMRKCGLSQASRHARGSADQEVSWPVFSSNCYSVDSIQNGATKPIPAQRTPDQGCSRSTMRKPPPPRMKQRLHMTRNRPTEALRRGVVRFRSNHPDNKVARRANVRPPSDMRVVSSPAIMKVAIDETQTTIARVFIITLSLWIGEMSAAFRRNL